MTRKTLLLIWGLGLLLAIVLDAIGPEHFLTGLLNGVAALQQTLTDTLINLTASVAHWIRAFAIALFVVFIVLGSVAWQRGRQSASTLVIATLIFLALAYDAAGAWMFDPNTRWLLAFLLALGGAVAMTRKLQGPAPSRPRPRVGPWPGGTKG